jgi:hypothetical protein
MRAAVARVLRLYDEAVRQNGWLERQPMLNGVHAAVAAG